MDGAEGLSGVYVLAATSRPDMIDPALLRPGRLDKSIICDIPSCEERLDILKCITRPMHLSRKVDLGALAEDTEGLTGADLQGIVSNSQLLAIHRVIDREDRSASKAKYDATHLQVISGEVSEQELREISEGVNYRLFSYVVRK